MRFLRSLFCLATDAQKNFWIIVKYNIFYFVSIFSLREMYKHIG